MAASANVVAVRTNHPLAPFIRGAVRLEEQPDGLVLPQRLFPEQMEHLDEIGRHERAMSTAGIVVDLATDGTEVSLDCRIIRPLNASHVLYRKVMDATWGKSTAFRKLSREEQNLVLSFINSFGVSCYRQWVADGKRITSSFI
jgi:hypothetical protein